MRGTVPPPGTEEVNRPYNENIAVRPWRKQWHNAVDPEFNLGRGDYFAGFVPDAARLVECTIEEVRAWQPPARSARAARQAAKPRSEVIRR